MKKLILTFLLFNIANASELKTFICKFDNQKTHMVLSSCFETINDRAFYEDMCMTKAHNYMQEGITSGVYKLSIKNFDTYQECADKLDNTLNELRRLYFIETKVDKRWSTINGKSHKVHY